MLYNFINRSRSRVKGTQHISTHPKYQRLKRVGYAYFQRNKPAQIEQKVETDIATGSIANKDIDLGDLKIDLRYVIAQGCLRMAFLQSCK